MPGAVIKVAVDADCAARGTVTSRLPPFPMMLCSADMKVALDWVNKSLEINRNPYFVWRLKSQIQAELRDYRGAVATAEIAGQKAREAGNHPVAKLIEEAIAQWGKMT